MKKQISFPLFVQGASYFIYLFLESDRRRRSRRSERSDLEDQSAVVAVIVSVVEHKGEERRSGEAEKRTEMGGDVNVAPGEERDKSRALALDRVLTRLALTSEKNYQVVIDKLLPAVIAELNAGGKLVLQKVVEILSHVNKVLTAEQGVKIPVKSLIEVCTGAEASHVARSYALMYAEKGFLRESAEFHQSMLLDLLTCSHVFKVQSAKSVLFRLVLISLEHCSRERLQEILSGESFKVFKNSAEDKLHFIEFATNFMLYLGPYNSSSTQHQQEVSPGLSAESMSQVKCQDETYQNTVQRKLKLLDFLINAGFEIELLLPLLLAAACDPNESVSSMGDQLLRKKCAISNVEPLVDLENAGLIQKLYELFHGSLQEAPQLSRRVKPAHLVLRLKILSSFIRSIRAANSFPLTVKTIFECLYAQTSNARLKLAGMEYTIWTLQHASGDQLASLGPLVLKGLIKFLHEHEQQLTRHDPSAVRMRQFSYEAISEMGRRLPQAFSNDVDIVSQLLRMITREDDQVKVSAMEAMRLLSSAYSSTGNQVKAKLEQMLTLMVSSPDESLRLLSIQWACTVFQLEELHGLYLCIIATSDESPQIFEEANKLLNWKMLKEVARKGLITTDRLVEYFITKNPEINSVDGLKRLNNHVLKNMIKSIRCVRTGELESNKQINVSHTQLLSCALSTMDTDLLIEAIQCMLIEANLDPYVFATTFSNCRMGLKILLGHTRESVRKGAAILCGLIFSTLSREEQKKVLDFKDILNLDIKKNFEKIQACVLAAGYTLGHSCLKQSETKELSDDFSQLMDKFSDLSDGQFPLNGVVGETIGIVSFCKGGRELPMSDDKMICTLKKFVVSPRSETVSSAIRAMGRVCAIPFSESDALVVGKLQVMEDLSFFLLDRVPKIEKESEAFALGEAFAYAFGLQRTTEEILLFSDSIMDSAMKALIYVDADAEPEASSETTKSFPKDYVEMCNDLLGRIIELSYHSDPKTRMVGSIILVQIIDPRHRHPSILKRVFELQNAFCELVKDKLETTQEMGSQGISLIYQISGEDMKKQLVENLVETLTSSTLKPKRMKISQDTEMFEGDTLGKDPNGKKISTYKHLCAIASDIGQPDVVYKFIQLFNENSLAKSKQGVAMGLASLGWVAELEQLQPKIVPKLYRLLHDPSSQVQESMNMLWSVLVEDNGATVQKYFPLIVEDLLQQLSSHLWRNRQSSACALADLIQGRKWIELREYFGRIWDGVFRVVDDIKETVRIAGVTLANSLQRTTARLCEGVTQDENSPAAVVFPILLTKGIASPVEEVKSLSLRVLYNLIKFSDKRLLSQFLPQIAGCLLESLSGLESTTMNYIEQHAERVGIDKENLDNLRVKAANASIVGDMLDRITACVNEENLVELSAKLSDLLKNGFGTNTRAGAARFLSSITLRMRYDMKPVCSKMLKALTFNLSADSKTVRRAYASTFAQLSKFSDPKHVDSRVDKLLKAIEEDDDNTTHSIFILELCRQAPDVFARYKQNVLPIAFFMKQSSEKKVSSIWESIWDEGAPSDSAAIRMYNEDIVKLCLNALKSEKWNTRKAGALAIKDLVEKCNGFLPDASTVCDALLSLLPGRFWEGKELCLDALGLLCSKISMSNSSIEEVLSALLECLKKKKKVLITTAAAAIEVVVSSVQASADFPVLLEVSETLLEICTRNENVDEEDRETSLQCIMISVKCLATIWNAMQAAKEKQDLTSIGLKLFTTLSEMISSESTWRIRNEALAATKKVLREGSKASISSEWLQPLGVTILDRVSIEKRERSLSLLINTIQVIAESYGQLMRQDWLESMKSSLESLDTISPSLAAEAREIINIL